MVTINRRDLLAGAAGLAVLEKGVGPGAWAQDGPEKPPLPLESRILFSGHSLVDAIFSGSGDRRQTLTSFDPSGPRNWRRVTIPGSPLSVRWDHRFGAPNEQEPVPKPRPFSLQNPQSPVIPARDMDQFDALFITEGGPFAPPLSPDRFNARWNDTQLNFDLWRDLAKGKTVYFWTIWPSLTVADAAPESDWQLLPDDRRDISPFLGFLDRYERSAEEWCARNGQIVAQIIPGHRLMWELYQRYHQPSPSLPGAWEDLWDDDIHVNHLGSVFVAVTVYRWLFGDFPDRAVIDQRLAEAATNQGLTADHVIDVVSATLSYRQGTGTDLQLGRFVPPVPFWDASKPGDQQGATVLGAGVSLNTPVGAGNGLYWELETEPEALFALFELSYTNSGAYPGVAIFCGDNPDHSPWDPKNFGLQLDDHEATRRIVTIEGDSFMAMARPEIWEGNQRQIIESYIGPMGLRTRQVDDPLQWLGEYNPRGTRSLPTTRIGVNVHWENNQMKPGAGNMTFARGLAYLSVPDRLTRLRLIAYFCDGVVP